jgi:hypothetical protein
MRGNACRGEHELARVTARAALRSRQLARIVLVVTTRAARVARGDRTIVMALATRAHARRRQRVIGMALHAAVVARERCGARDMRGLCALDVTATACIGGSLLLRVRRVTRDAGIAAATAVRRGLLRVAHGARRLASFLVHGVAFRAALVVKFDRAMRALAIGVTRQTRRLRIARQEVMACETGGRFSADVNRRLVAGVAAHAALDAWPPKLARRELVAVGAVRAA